MQNAVITNTHWNNLKNKHEDRYSQLNTIYEHKSHMLWVHMNPEPRQCFTHILLDELIDAFSSLRHRTNVNFAIFASQHKNKFNLGGDLSFFHSCIEKKDKLALQKYAYKCIDAMYILYKTSFESNTMMISLVQGDALGGGFEAALATDVLIAEKGARFGLPEILFNMFPGMGAYSFLLRKIGEPKTKEMITSGKIYLAEELFEMGIVDVLAEPHHGDMAVYEYISKIKRSSNTFDALKKVKHMAVPITYEEMKNIVDVWVDSAMRLTQRDLKMMLRLVGRQNKINTEAV